MRAHTHRTLPARSTAPTGAGMGWGRSTLPRGRSQRGGEEETLRYRGPIKSPNARWGGEAACSGRQGSGGGVRQPAILGRLYK